MQEKRLDLMKLVALNDKGEKVAAIGDEIVYLPCLGKGCMKKFRQEVYDMARKNIIVKKEYGKWQNIVCPHCGTKQKVKCYKNGSVTIELRSK